LLVAGFAAEAELGALVPRVLIDLVQGRGQLLELVLVDLQLVLELLALAEHEGQAAAAEAAETAAAAAGLGQDRGRDEQAGRHHKCESSDTHSKISSCKNLKHLPRRRYTASDCSACIFRPPTHGAVISLPCK